VRHAFLAVTLALLGARELAAQCSTPECVAFIELDVTSPQTTYDQGGTIRYVIHARNTSSQMVGPFELVVDAADAERDRGPCASDNAGWSLHGVVGSRRVDYLYAGQQASFRYCIVVPAARNALGDYPVCTVSLRAALYTTAEPVKWVDEASILHRNRLPCFGSCALEGDLQCCVAETLQCIIQPFSAYCGEGGVAPGSAKRVASLWSTALATTGRFFASLSDLPLLYLVRDGVLAGSPGGRRGIALYYAHTTELKRLMLADTTLRGRAIDVLTDWRPLLRALVDGKGGTARVTSAQIVALRTLLDELSAAGSPALRQDIAREADALHLDTLVGLTADQGLKRLDHLSCVPDANTLCLSGGRVRVETTWETREGQRGRGRAVPLTGDTGTFWFFDAANVETVVKVLDGCGLDDRRWFFAAGLTDVRVVTTVNDTATGAVKVYTNPLGHGFAPVLDTDALDCTP